MIQQRHAGVAVRPHHQTRKPAEKFSVRNQGSAIIVIDSVLIKNLRTLNSPCLHIVIVIAESGGVKEGGGGDHYGD